MPSRAVLWVKGVVHLLLLLPLLFLLRAYRSGALAGQDDPVSWVTHFTGHWALWILLGTLAITPLRRLHRSLSWVGRLRRLVGLYAFFYATLHGLVYVFLFSGYDTMSALDGLRKGKLTESWHQLVLIWPTMVSDVLQRRFLQAGLLAWVLLLLLAATSPQGALRRLGGATWRRVHRLVYVAASAALVHWWWQLKAGETRPWAATLELLALFAVRVVLSGLKRWGRRRSGKPPVSP